MLIVKIPFVGFGFNMPNPGELIDPAPDVAKHLLDIGVAEQYETKVMPPPAEAKKKPQPSESSRPVRAAPKRTRKSSRKSATKSS